jgi:tellurite methyltransferase
MDYTNKKYGMIKTHSEVIEEIKLIKPSKVLDLGCGDGRNALHLNLLGFYVCALDRSEHDIARLNQIADSESLKNYYEGWEIIKYNKNMGELHKTDINGNRIKLRFATLLAKKVSS